MPVPQPDDGVTYAPKLTTDDARVRWDSPALRIDRFIRACTPAPGAWTTFRDKRLGLRTVTITSEPSTELEPGELHVDRSGVFVGTGSAPVALGDVQPQGKA